MTTFGHKSIFAIEVDRVWEADSYHCSALRFWIGGEPVGDWEETTLLTACILWMEEFCEYQAERILPESHLESAEGLFRELYRNYYEGDPNASTSHLRTFFHMDQTGMSSFVDKYGILLVTSNNGTARLIWKCLEKGEKLHDFTLVAGEVERIGREFVAWGKTFITHERMAKPKQKWPQ